MQLESYTMDSRSIFKKMFAAELEKKEGDVGIRGRDPVIHDLIREIPDSVLPSILSIFVDQRYNLESRDLLDETPLSVAASCLKKNTVTFLIEHKAEINDPLLPALCAAIDTNFLRDKSQLDMAKTLVQHGAAINVQDKWDRSPLICATKRSCVPIMRFLLSQGASLVLKYTFASGTQFQTAIGIAYDNYIKICDGFKEGHPYRIKPKKSLDLLTQAAMDYVYRQAVGFNGNDEALKIHLAKCIDDLAGNFQNCAYPKANSVLLKKYLEKTVLQSALSRIKSEKSKKQEKLEKWRSKEETRYASSKRTALFGRSKGQQFYGLIEASVRLRHS